MSNINKWISNITKYPIFVHFGLPYWSTYQRRTHLGQEYCWDAYQQGTHLRTLTCPYDRIAYSSPLPMKSKGTMFPSRSSVHPPIPSVCPSIHRYRPFFRPSTDTVRLSVHLPIPSVCPSIHRYRPFFRPSTDTVRLSVHPPIPSVLPSIYRYRPFVRPSTDTVRSSVHPPIPSVCPSIHRYHPFVRPSTDTVRLSIYRYRPFVRPAKLFTELPWQLALQYAYSTLPFI